MGPRERRKHSRSKTHTVPIIIASFFGFILLAGIAFGVGMLANVSRWLSDLPNYTDKNQYLVSEPSTILDANGNEIATLYVQNRQNVALDQVSQYVRNGTVATEDERYYEHGGIDLVGIARAVVVQLTGGSEGASTITQQLVRNTILSEEQFDQTIERKVREAWIAIKMEEIFSKDDILEMYLNTIYYGHGAYGIQAAAHTYFSKNCSDLTLAEAALLVGIPNAPSTYDPTVNPDLAKQRRNIVLDRMLSNGCITQEEHDAAQAEDIVLNVTETPENGTLAYPYFVDYVKSVLQEEFSTDMIFKGGLTVKTTIDPTMQAAAEQAVDETYTAQRADELDCGAVAIDPKTGYIKVMYGGRNYNDAAGAHTNHALARRSVGSTFKGITLAAAIKAGMDPSVTLNCSSPMTIKTYSGGTVTIKNAGNHNYGVRTLASATAVSSNTAYVQVQAAIGYNALKTMASDLGIDTENETAEFRGQDNLTLGTCYLTPLEMAEAYATFASGGYHRDAVAITEVLSRDGSQLYAHQDNPTQVLTTGQAEAVTNVLETVIKSGTGTGARLSVDQPVAGKTGTASNGDDRTTDVWFVGYTPQLCTAVWSGRSSSNEPIGYGTTQLPIPIFRKFMNAALKDAGHENFPTGEKPTYKQNSSWNFSGGGGDTDSSSKSENTESTDSTVTEEGATEGGTTTTEPTPNPGTGGDTGGSTGGSTGGGGTTGGGSTGGGSTGGGSTGGTGGGSTGGGSTGGGSTGGGSTGGGTGGGGTTTTP